MRITENNYTRRAINKRIESVEHNPNSEYTFADCCGFIAAMLYVDAITMNEFKKIHEYIYNLHFNREEEIKK